MCVSLWTDHRSNGLHKNSASVLHFLGRALNIIECPNFLRQFLALIYGRKVSPCVLWWCHIYNNQWKAYLLLRDWLFSHLWQSCSGLLVIPKVYFCASKDNRHIWAVMHHLRVPFFQHIVKWCRVVHRKANNEDILKWKNIIWLSLMNPIKILINILLFVGKQVASTDHNLLGQRCPTAAR